MPNNTYFDFGHEWRLIFRPFRVVPIASREKCVFFDRGCRTQSLLWIRLKQLQYLINNTYEYKSRDLTSLIKLLHALLRSDGSGNFRFCINSSRSSFLSFLNGCCNNQSTFPVKITVFRSYLAHQANVQKHAKTPPHRNMVFVISLFLNIC
jgi:hypothetical protein